MRPAELSLDVVNENLSSAEQKSTTRLTTRQILRFFDPVCPIVSQSAFISGYNIVIFLSLVRLASTNLSSRMKEQHSFCSPRRVRVLYIQSKISVEANHSTYTLKNNNICLFGEETPGSLPYRNIRKIER